MLRGYPQDDGLKLFSSFMARFVDRPETIADSFDLDDCCVVQEAVEYGCGGRNVADEFAPFFERPV